jgi:hypothetical protein
MRIPAFLLALAAVWLCGAAANAQATRTWVSGVGDDANPCSRTAPCKTFAGAISKTLAGGEIDAMDPGGFGAVTITKSITIDGGGGTIAGVLVAGTNGIVISDSGAGTAVVTLRNLDFEGLGFGPTTPGIHGVLFLSGAALYIQHCSIRNFRDPTNGWGVAFTPSTASKLFIDSTIITGNLAGGVLIQPTGAGSAKALIEQTQAHNNTTGFRADGTGSTGGITVAISGSTASGNVASGVTAFSQAGSAAVTMMVSVTTVANNGTGLNANGSAATMRVGASVVSGNAIGVNIANGATMTSFGSNQIRDNTTPGPTIPILGPS